MTSSRLFLSLIEMLLAMAAGIAALLGAAGPARAALSDCIDATCRITTADGSRGSGCVFEITQGSVYVLTAAHVVGNNPAVQCEFWRDGHQSSPLAGRVVGRSEAVDAAIVVVPEAALGGILPAAIPLAARQSEIRPGDTLVSVGCANGAWSTSWKGHALGCEDGQLHFLPTPANGRSGSAIFDAQGEHIVALLRARTGDDSEGIAMPVSAIYRVFDVAASSSAATAPAPVQCGPGGCPPGGCCPGGSCPSGNCPLPQPWQNHLLPYRNRHDAPNPTPQPGPGGSGPWPSLPAVDLSRLDEKLGRIAALLEDLKRNEESGAAAQRAAGGAPPPPGEPAKLPVDEQARKLAEAALGQVADLRTETAKGLRDVKTDAAKTNEAVGGLTTAVEKIKDSIEENGTISQRFHARVDKVKTELEDKLGHEASDREVRIAYMKDLIQDKLGDGGALRSLLLPAALAVVVWLIARDVKNNRASGDPLAVEKLAALVEGKVGALNDRMDALEDRLPVAATHPGPAPAAGAPVVAVTTAPPSAPAKPAA